MTGAQAIIQGLSEDKGFLCLQNFLSPPFTIEEMLGKSYQEIAEKVIGAFFDDYTEEEMQRLHPGSLR